jgi:BirA family biotin operon repressor/biotin-[acetyl-CoA-carboxylase] ligase
MRGTEPGLASADDVRLAASSGRLLRVAETASTNTLALDRALAGATLPLWVLADRQTAGRGRAGRAWQAAEGNLFASLAISPAEPPQRAGELSLVAGVAVIEAVRALIPTAHARLKWPNDVMIEQGKVGGILIESTSLGARRLAVIGIGLNLAAAPSDVPYAAALPDAVGPLDMLAALAGSLGRWLDRWNAGSGFAAVREAWLPAADPLGTPITVNAGRSRLAGTYAGLADDGALLLARPDGRTERITFGDVIVAPHDEDQPHEHAP